MEEQEKSQELEPVPGKFKQLKLRMEEHAQAMKEKLEALKKKNEALLSKIKEQSGIIKEQAKKLGDQAMVLKAKVESFKFMQEEPHRLFIVHEEYNGIWGRIKRKGDVYIIRDASICQYNTSKAEIQIAYHIGDLEIPYDDMSMIVAKEMEVIDLPAIREEVEEEMMEPEVV